MAITEGRPGRPNRLPPTFDPELKRPVASAFAFGKPFGRGFDRGREIAAFAKPRRMRHDEKPRDGADQGMAQGGEPPKTTGQGESPAQSQDVHQPADQQQTDGISGLEGDLHVPVLAAVQSNAVLQFRRQVAEDSPVDVIGGGDPEKQGADGPAITACRRPGFFGGIHKVDTFIKDHQYIKR